MGRFGGRTTSRVLITSERKIDSPCMKLADKDRKNGALEIGGGSGGGWGEGRWVEG